MISLQISIRCLLIVWTTFTAVTAPPLKVLKPNGDCMPGELVWVECNLCTCNPQGKPNQVCAAMWCQPVPTTSKPHSQQNLQNMVQYSSSRNQKNSTRHSVHLDQRIKIKNANNLTEIKHNDLPAAETTTTSGLTQTASTTTHEPPHYLQE